jgi:hypothetical protein
VEDEEAGRSSSESVRCWRAVPTFAVVAAAADDDDGGDDVDVDDDDGGGLSGGGGPGESVTSHVPLLSCSSSCTAEV